MTQDTDLASRVKQLIGEHLGIATEEVTPEKTLVADLGADSLDAVELVMGLEDEFGFEVSDTDAEKILTVQDAIDTVVRLTPKPEAA